MSYEEHNENQCDKCNKVAGKNNLVKAPFHYLDCNDKAHPDMGRGYRQYYVCDKCLARGV